MQTKVSDPQQSTLTAQATDGVQADRGGAEEARCRLAPTTPRRSSSTRSDRPSTRAYSTTALAGYKKFVKLAPDDPKAAVAKQAIKSLAPVVGGDLVAGPVPSGLYLVRLPRTRPARGSR